MKLHCKIKSTHKSYAHLHQILISTLYLTLSSTTLALNLINPLNNHPDTSSPDPSILKVGANQGYIVAFGKYRQDSDGSKPIAWRILDSENSDHNSNLSPVKAGETQTPEEAAINGDAKGLTLFAQKILDNTKRFGDNADWRNSDVRSFLNEGYTRPSDDREILAMTVKCLFTLTMTSSPPPSVQLSLTLL